jgi:hypothetical protein
MTRTMIRAADETQYQRAKALVDGRAHVLVTSDRRRFLSVADLPAGVAAELRKAGLTLSEERPAFAPGLRADGTIT